MPTKGCSGPWSSSPRFSRTDSQQETGWPNGLESPAKRRRRRAAPGRGHAGRRAAALLGRHDSKPEIPAPHPAADPGKQILPAKLSVLGRRPGIEVGKTQAARLRGGLRARRTQAKAPARGRGCHRGGDAKTTPRGGRSSNWPCCRNPGAEEMPHL